MFAPPRTAGVRANRVGGGADAPSVSLTDLLPGLDGLRALTRGDPRICVAVLDGPVDRRHPSLRGADLTAVEGLVPSAPDGGPATRHGTHVASVIFGQPGGPVDGLAPRCRGVVIPIFESADDGTFRACSQLDFARALTEAVRHGAHVINVSGGQFAPSGAAHPLLAGVVRDVVRRGVLVVAAAGNEGCDCPQVPAAQEGVLAVGATDAGGEPLGFSNWGGRYQAQGILAPGEGVPGAGLDGGTAPGTGTSYAAAVVSGVTALLLSLQLQRGERPDPRRVRETLLRSANRCHE